MAVIKFKVLGGYALKLLPHPQVAVALGLTIAKLLLIKSFVNLIVEPLRYSALI